MNIKRLSNGAMITVSGYWLEDLDVQAAMRSHFLGVALLEQVKVAHIMLVNLHHNRLEIQEALAHLSTRLSKLGNTYVRCARGLYHCLTGLIELAHDPAGREWYSELRARLFPKGLVIVKRAYNDKSGHARSLQTIMTPELRARLARVVVGDDNLDQLCQRWIAAGRELGECLAERAKVGATGASTGPRRAELNVTRVRSTWIRTANTIIESLDLMNMNDAQRLTIVAPLETWIQCATRARKAPLKVIVDMPVEDTGEQPASAPDTASDAEVAPDAKASAPATLADSAASAPVGAAHANTAAPEPAVEPPALARYHDDILGRDMTG